MASLTCSVEGFLFPIFIETLEGTAWLKSSASEACWLGELSQHQKASGKSLEYFDEETKQRFVPHVVEPSAGVDRTVLALICEAYSEDQAPNEKGDKPKLVPAKQLKNPEVKPCGAGRRSLGRRGPGRTLVGSLSLRRADRSCARRTRSS